MYSNILFTLINILLLIKKSILLEKYRKVINNINLFMVFLNIILITLSIIDNTFNNILLITSAIHIITTMFTFNKKIYLKEDISKIICLSVIALIIIDKVGKGYTNNIIIITLLFLNYLLNIYYLIKLLVKNREYLCFHPSNIDILSDIKFSLKIELHKTINFFIYWSVLIIMLKIKFKYCEIGYILIFLLIISYLIIYYNKLKKILLDIDNNVIFKNEYPSKVASFLIYKYLLRMKSLSFYLIFYCLTILLFYLNKDLFISIPLYIMYLYVIIDNKLKLINHIYSINKELILKDYKLIKNNNVTKYLVFKLFKLKFYKLKINNYTSTLMIFNPDLIIKKVDIRVNTKNDKDYIIDLSKYFM